MSKNVRISLYILIPIIVWMISGQFVDDSAPQIKENNSLTSVVIKKSTAAFFAPKITLNASATSEKRVNVMAKTSGEVMPHNISQGQWVDKDQVLCKLGVVALNRTEVKAPFRGYVERIVKPGNLLSRGQVCAVIIELDPLTFVAEVPEADIKTVVKGQNVSIQLVTGETISSKLSFVSKSATPSTRSFRVEVEVKNPQGLIRNGMNVLAIDMLHFGERKTGLLKTFKNDEKANNFLKSSSKTALIVPKNIAAIEAGKSIHCKII